MDSSKGNKNKWKCFSLTQGNKDHRICPSRCTNTGGKHISISYSDSWWQLTGKRSSARHVTNLFMYFLVAALTQRTLELPLFPSPGHRHISRNGCWPFHAQLGTKERGFCLERRQRFFLGKQVGSPTGRPNRNVNKFIWSYLFQTA